MLVNGAKWLEYCFLAIFIVGIVMFFSPWALDIGLWLHPGAFDGAGEHNAPKPGPELILLFIAMVNVCAFCLVRGFRTTIEWRVDQ